MLKNNSVQIHKEDPIFLNKLNNNFSNNVNQKKLTKSYNEYYKDDELLMDNERCMPRFQLTRIEHTDFFSKDYILKVILTIEIFFLFLLKYIYICQLFFREKIGRLYQTFHQ